MSVPIFMALFILFVGSAVFCNQRAKAKRLNSTFWTMMGLIFGPLAIPFLLVKRSN